MRAHAKPRPWARPKCRCGGTVPTREFDSRVPRYASPMEQDTATLEAPESTDELVEEELLVEEISIDGMCGVY